MRLLKLVLLVVSLCIMCSLATTAPAAGPELIAFYTPAVGGTGYILGAGVVTVTNKYLPELKMVHESTTGSMEIVRRMMQREAQKKDCFGLFGTVDAWNAMYGKNEYAGKPFAGIRALTYVLGTDVYLVVPTNSPIKSWADVKGRRIGIGGPGSTSANTALYLLEEYGIFKKDFKPYYFVYRETVEGIQNDSLDGGILVGGYPVAAYSELATQRAVRIVPVDEKILKKVTTEHPYYYRAVIKAKSYKGLEQDTPVLGFTTAIYAHDAMSTDLVYKVIKNLFEHKADYYAIHASAKDMSVEDVAKGIPIPFHPGAIKYLKEIGAMK
ncbi:MAG TPA: TAXI family TRAP transporter solute-binding subunit [Syntrophorhabdales bacterium]|nr:TAXI family TRAP transporter solute-binding subunit [Syntrophorhabdales bacterium]